MAKLFHQNAENPSGGFMQRHGDRFLIHNPPPPPLSTRELDEIYEIDFEGDAHPYYKTGEIRALDTIKQSITTHRGCFGQCNFCSISLHQGSIVVSRSVKSITDEATRISRMPGFNGIIYDVGGPTANMYGTTCVKGWDCVSKRCLMPRPCPSLRFGHKLQIEVLDQIRGITGIEKAFVSTGIRPDLVIADRKNRKRYVEQLVRYHVSGQIKLAPEHSEKELLLLMNKPSIQSLMEFREMFNSACTDQCQSYFMTYYFIAAHPGCTPEHTQRLKDFLSAELKTTPKQVQIFTPTPSTLSTAMYHCETDLKGNSCFCEKSLHGMQRQKDILIGNGGRRSLRAGTPAKTHKTAPRRKSGPQPRPRRSPRTRRGQKFD
jgi:uncharacterized radical SAM protein YgiQ